MSATLAAGAAARCGRSLIGGRYCRADGDIACDTYAKSVALDFNFRETGLVEQRSELADNIALLARFVAGFDFCRSPGWRDMISIRNFLGK